MMGAAPFGLAFRRKRIRGRPKRCTLGVMRRRPFTRVFASVFALWFAVALVEPALLHACPVHDTAASPTQAAAHAHAGHEAAPSSQPSAGEHCLCLGDCAHATALGLPSVVTRLDARVSAQERDPGLPDYAYVPVAAAHVIPFANGPPTA